MRGSGTRLNGTGENSPLRAPIALPLAFRIRELSKNPSLFLTDPLVGGTIHTRQGERGSG
jgi:hypothetical protein